ncbi:STAS domain-containing protein [Streptomyces sp. NPDC088254]|uniref:STAS domain-containing protein n=1 Tax=Streptomyces sp. NPDC088254 TaxID=3365847 RepID=UPI0037F274EE
MAAEPQSVPPGAVITAIDGQHAEVTLSGDVSAVLLRDLEAQLADPHLRKADHWVLNLSGATRIDLACAYALLRAVTEHSGATAVRGGRRAVLRTLRHAGLDKATVIEVGGTRQGSVIHSLRIGRHSTR